MPARLLPLGIVSGAFLWCFWRVLLGDNNFALRDAAHFYYPLFEYVQAQWSAGRIPLWNPYENSGEPLLANSTSSVFYPGKLVFLLPIRYAWAYKLYILMHVLLAAGAAYFLARRWGTSRSAATLCALSYAFSGQVLYQYQNVVFLCSAAWLPLGLAAADAMLLTRRWLYCGLLGAVLAMMILSGDPQLAYETGALAALGALLYWRAGRREARAARPNQDASWRHSRPALLALAAAWMAGLAAVQLLPTSELSGLSDRDYFDVPRNVYEIPEWTARDHASPQRDDGTAARWYDGLIGKHPTTVVHLRALYNFSLPPWRLAELIWPNVSGRSLPQYRRWLSALTDEGRHWTPTIYMGLLPLLLAASVWRLRGAEPRIAWLSWMVLIGVVASFGRYGLGWLWSLLADKPPVGQEVGGLYWLMTVLLPGFVQFRFPSKLLTLAALGLSVLAALGWQQWEQGQMRRLTRSLLATGVASIIALVALALVAPFWRAWFTGKVDLFFGPMDVDGAYWGVAVSLVHTLILSALLSICARPPWPADKRAASAGGPIDHWGPTAALLLTGVEICVANSWLVVTAPAETWTAPSRGAQLIRAAEQKQNEPLPRGDWPRLFRLEMAPQHFKDASSPTRPQESVEWDRDTLRPKYAMTEGFSHIRVQGTIQLFDYHEFLAPMVLDDPATIVQPRRALDALGVKYFILPRLSDRQASALWLDALLHRWKEPASGAAQSPPLAPKGARLEAAVNDPARWLGEMHDVMEVLANDSVFPRAWIVHDIYITPHIESSDRPKLMPMLATLLSPTGQYFIDMRQAAWVDNDELDQITPQGRIHAPAEDPSTESCRITDYQPQRVEIEAVLTSPGLVVLSDLYYPGWELTVTEGERLQHFPILRTNRVMRGALLPAGRFKLVYEYRPSTFYTGAAISVAAWIAAIVALVAMLARQRRATSAMARR